MKQRCITILLVALFSLALLPGRGAGVEMHPSEGDSLNSPRYLYTEGIKYLSIHADSAAARRLWLRAVALDSLYAPACYKLAELSLQQADAPTALLYAERAYRGDTTNKFYLALYAHAQVMALRFQPALHSFRQLIRLDRQNPENYRMMALLEEQVGGRKAAIALLDSAEVLFGSNSRLGSVKRRMLMADRQYDRALQEAEAMVEAVPYEAENHLILGEILAMRGEDSLARRSLHRALEVDSTHLETMLTLADLYSQRQEFIPYLGIIRRIFEQEEFPLERKVDLFNRLTGDMRFYREYYPQISTLARTLAMRYPKEPSVVNLYAGHQIASGEVEQALALYKLHLEDEPPRLDYYTTIIDIERYLERPDSADHYLKRAIDRFPDRYELHLQRAFLEAGMRRNYAAAEASYEAALERVESDSLRSVVWGLMGDLHHLQIPVDTLPDEVVFRDLKQNKAARKHLARCYQAYEKALKYDPENHSVLNNYAYFLALEGRDLERALVLSSRVVALKNEKNPTYLDTHAWVLHKLGRHEEAKRYLQQAVSLDGQRSADLQIHYGDVLAALGEEFMAEVYWKRALENGYYPAEVLRRIEALKEK